MAIFYAIGQIYIPINGQILKIVWPSGHTTSIILLRSTLSLNIFTTTYVSVKVLRTSRYRDAEVFSYEKYFKLIKQLNGEIIERAKNILLKRIRACIE